jgi:hypothetical protein
VIRDFIFSFFELIGEVSPDIKYKDMIWEKVLFYILIYGLCVPILFFVMLYGYIKYHKYYFFYKELLNHKYENFADFLLSGNVEDSLFCNIHTYEKQFKAYTFKKEMKELCD